MILDNCIIYIIGKDNKWETFKLEFTYFVGGFIAIECSSDDVSMRNIKG